MTWIVPLILGSLAIGVMALFSMLAARRRRVAPVQPAAPAPSVLVHDINDDRCTGCDACVAVCPTNVLDLVNNKSRVLRFQDCIQCEACMWACPTEALVMFPEHAEPPALKVPELDDCYQTAVPGQYLIGEVAGKPLVKNAANLGRGVIEHMLRGGLAAGALGDGAVDVAIVGSGPGGLSAALACIQRGLSYVILEKEQQIASTIARYPKGKLVMAEPYDAQNMSLLPVFDSSKEQIIPIWRELIDRVGLTIKQGEAVESVARQPDGSFDLRTTVAAYRAQRVVLATGTRGKPRTLQVPGENLPKVSNLLDDPDELRGRDVLVVGGGDSAVEAALALADAGARVIVSYRGKSFNRAQPKNKQAIEAYAAQNKIKVKFGSQVVAFEPDSVLLGLADNSQKRYPNVAAYILIGADPPVTWLEKLGVRFVLRPHQYALGKTDDFVRRMLPTAAECPRDAAAVAAMIGGQDAPLPSAAERALAAISLPEPVHGPKKWLRAATGIFSSAPKKIDQPMPLSEFAKRPRTHGSGRRDQLSPGERTRVLRMLRDEGGRLADEDSKVSFVELSEVVSASGLDRESPPVVAADLLAKPAVIVGLARANATGPRNRSRLPSEEGDVGPGAGMAPGKPRRASPTGSPPPVPVRPGASPPSLQLDPARPPPPPPGRTLRRGPSPVVEDFRLDDPTRATEVDPRALAALARGDTGSLDTGSLDTLYDGDADDLDLGYPSAPADRASAATIDLGLSTASGVELDLEEATQLGDMSNLVARERERGVGAGATTRKRPGETRDPRPGRAPGAESPRASGVGPSTLSDVEWDLD